MFPLNAEMTLFHLLPEDDVSEEYNYTIVQNKHWSLKEKEQETQYFLKMNALEFNVCVLNF